MPRCAATKPDNLPCERIVPVSQRYCYAHDPARADERKRNATRAGKSKPNREIGELKGLLADLTSRVITGDLETGPAAVANQLIGTQLRAIEFERRLRETEELAERLDELERATGANAL